MCMFCTTDSFKSLIARGPLCIRYKSGNYENFRNDIKSLLLYFKKHIIFQGTLDPAYKQSVHLCQANLAVVEVCPIL